MKGYVGVFLTPTSVQELKHLFPPVFEKKQYHHVTLLFKPSEIQMERVLPLLGANVNIRVTDYVVDEKAEALIVDLDSAIAKLAPPGKILHITLSHSSAVSPVYSNELAAKAEWEKVPLLTVGGVLGYFENGEIFYDSKEISA